MAKKNMITKEEVRELLHSTETFRVERTTSTGDMDKFQEAICAFSNDLPNSKKNGYLILGAYDDGTLSGLKVDDDLLKKISSIRSNGNILPLPVMSVERFEYDDGDLLVAEVSPSLVPPVRYRGRTFVRIGPRRDIASESEERILFERRTSYMATFDATPCFGATINDIDTDFITREYLPQIIDNEVLANDNRDINQRVKNLLQENGNTEPVFNVDKITAFEVIVKPTLSLNLVTDEEKVTKSVTKLSDTLNEIMVFSSTPQSMAEIMEHLGLKHRYNVKHRYIDPLIKGGFLVMTIPQKANSRSQKYVRALT